MGIFNMSEPKQNPGPSRSPVSLHWCLEEAQRPQRGRDAHGATDAPRGTSWLWLVPSTWQFLHEHTRSRGFPLTSERPCRGQRACVSTNMAFDCTTFMCPSSSNGIKFFFRKPPLLPFPLSLSSLNTIDPFPSSRRWAWVPEKAN